MEASERRTLFLSASEVVPNLFQRTLEIYVAHPRTRRKKHIPNPRRNSRFKFTLPVTQLFCQNQKRVCFIQGNEFILFYFFLPFVLHHTEGISDMTKHLIQFSAKPPLPAAVTSHNSPAVNHPMQPPLSAPRHHTRSVSCGAIDDGKTKNMQHK